MAEYDRLYGVPPKGDAKFAWMLHMIHYWASAGKYRDSRNDTAHKYGEHFAEAILELLPAFIADAKALVDTIETANDG